MPYICYCISYVISCLFMNMSPTSCPSPRPSPSYSPLVQHVSNKHMFASVDLIIIHCCFERVESPTLLWLIQFELFYIRHYCISVLPPMKQINSVLPPTLNNRNDKQGLKTWLRSPRRTHKTTMENLNSFQSPQKILVAKISHSLAVHKSWI